MTKQMNVRCGNLLQLIFADDQKNVIMRYQLDEVLTRLQGIKSNSVINGFLDSLFDFQKFDLIRDTRSSDTPNETTHSPLIENINEMDVISSCQSFAEKQTSPSLGDQCCHIFLSLAWDLLTSRLTLGEKKLPFSFRFSSKENMVYSFIGLSYRPLRKKSSLFPLLTRLMNIASQSQK